MSAEVRTALTAAVNTIEGVTCAPYFVPSTAAGTSYVRLDRVEYPNRFGGVAYWEVVLLCPQDLAAAEQYAEIKLPELRAALADELVLQGASLNRLDIPNVGVIPAVIVNGFREY